MLRNFAQMLRSGVTGRRSLGTRPKEAGAALVAERQRRAFIAARWAMRRRWRISSNGAPTAAGGVAGSLLRSLIGKLRDKAQLPEKKRARCWRFVKRNMGAAYLMCRFTADQRAAESRTVGTAGAVMSWQTLRMNLNTLAS